MVTDEATPRRRFLRNAAVGGAVVWAAPAVTTVRGLGAQEVGSPAPGDDDITPPIACEIDADLRNWLKFGASGYSWNVNSASQVTQSFNDTNGWPGLFVSPDACETVRLTGTMRVNTTTDDDMIGLVLGYTAPLTTGGLNSTLAHDMVLFDWKRLAQTHWNSFAPQGRVLARILGDVTYQQNPGADHLPVFWAKDDADTRVTRLGATTGSGTGWVANTTYTFDVSYSPTNIKIVIGGTTFFDVNGSFPAGRVGFYNNSQANVTYVLSSLTTS